jgi:O-methyltransferase
MRLKLWELAKKLLPDGAVGWVRRRRGGIPRHQAIALRHTVMSPIQLLFLDEVGRRVREQGIAGDFVECGVYRGGSAAVLGVQMMHSPGERRLRLFDSFRGMPDPGPRDDDPQSAKFAGAWVGSEREVRRLLRRVGVPEDRCEVVEGWFEQTLPAAEKRPIAVLSVDCDFYDPVGLVLEQLYPHVSPGGFVLVNDYGAFVGARRATDEFLARELPGTELTQLDKDAVYFQKP